MNVAANATSPQVNQASVSGGGAAGATASDSTIITPSPGGVTLNMGSGSGAPGSMVTLPITIAGKADKTRTDVSDARAFLAKKS